VTFSKKETAEFRVGDAKGADFTALSHLKER
jgi:hypothetical protein